MHSEYKIEPGMKVAVRRGVLQHIGVVIRLEGRCMLDAIGVA
jgi:hypothetical protein